MPIDLLISNPQTIITAARCLLGDKPTEDDLQTTRERRHDI